MTDSMSSSKSSVWSTLNLKMLCVRIWANHGFTMHMLQSMSGECTNTTQLYNQVSQPCRRGTDGPRHRGVVAAMRCVLAPRRVY